MRLARHYLESIQGIEIFAYIGLAIFLLFFIAVIIHTLMIPRDEIRKYERIPLDEENENSTNNH